MPVRYWIAAVSMLLAALGAGLWYQQSSPSPVPLLAATTSPGDHQTITVHVSGQVLAPGLVEITAGSRVADAVAAAGGTTRNADLSRINLAAPVDDGQQIVILDVHDRGAAGAGGDDGRVSINTAGPNDLERLPGVGPVLAARIAAHREENGPFVVVEDLLDVPGIGEAKLEALRDSVALP